MATTPAPARLLNLMKVLLSMTVGDEGKLACGFHNSTTGVHVGSTPPCVPFKGRVISSPVNETSPFVVDVPTTTEVQVDPTASPPPRRSHRWLWFVVVPIVLVGAFSVWMWRESRGLEQRVLSAIQPHLLTDVGVSSVELTLWSSWPDVEVVLHDVRIEDAVNRGQPFVELKDVGVVFGWLPLLEGRFEAHEVVLRSGRLDIQRTTRGLENWRFWKTGGGDGQMDWNVGAVRLEEVDVGGEWWSDGASDPVRWSARCVSARMDMDKMAEGIGWHGDAILKAGTLEAAGSHWLEAVDVTSAFALRTSNGGVELDIQAGELANSSEAVPFSLALNSSDGFAMTLDLMGAESARVMDLLPSAIRASLAFEGEVSGPLDARVLVGRQVPSVGWTGPVDPRWDGAWAIRLSPRNLMVRQRPGAVRFKGGSAEVFSLSRGWKAVWQEAAGQWAEGEFRVSGDWTDGRLHLDGEAVARPSALAAWVPKGELMDGWVWKEGGVVRLGGELLLVNDGGSGWRWLEGEASVVGESLELASGAMNDPALRTLGVGRISAKGNPGRWDVAVQGLETDGLDGDFDLVGGTASDWKLDARLAEADVEQLMTGWGGMMRDRAVGGSVPMPDVNWKLSLGDLRWGSMVLQGIQCDGTFAPAASSGKVDQLSGQAFGGQVSGSGQWNPRTVRFDGLMSGASLADALEGTDGLGQSTLMPHHVKGTVWAEGQLAYHFDRVGADAWETDLDVRWEEGELIGFELLQRIPEVLREEPKYRILADVDDLERRLGRVRFQPVDAHISLDRGLFTLDPTDVVSDAMDVGVGGWQRLSGAMDYTLDFALRDLKSDREEFGMTADDGLGHRFFLAMRGTLDAPEFGYDRLAHKEHRQEERRAAIDRLKGLVTGSDEEVESMDSVGVVVQAERGVEKERKRRDRNSIDDDDDDYR